jgi:hypothetical protein
MRALRHCAMKDMTPYGIRNHCRSSIQTAAIDALVAALSSSATKAMALAGAEVVAHCDTICRHDVVPKLLFVIRNLLTSYKSFGTEPIYLQRQKLGRDSVLKYQFWAC